MSKAFVFPGQGAQVIGMGKALADAYPAARAVFDEVDDALGEKLSTLCFEGPEDALKLKLQGSETGTTVGVNAMGTDGVKNVVLEEKKAVSIAGRVREEVISVDGPDISSEALTNWMRGRRGAIVSCYERELKRDHSLSGRLVLKFIVSTRGRVTDLDLTEGTMQNAAVRECISSLAKNWVLPFTPEDEVPVAFPFVFSPVN